MSEIQIILMVSVCVNVVFIIQKHCLYGKLRQYGYMQFNRDEGCFELVEPQECPE
jgi:hypothetical protein